MREPTGPPVQRTPLAAGEADSEVRVDRRRPGRIEYANAQLIALLRSHIISDKVTSDRPDAEGSPAEAPQPEGEESDEADDLAAVRGIAFGILLVAPFWAGIVALGWWWLTR